MIKCTAGVTCSVLVQVVVSRLSVLPALLRTVQIQAMHFSYLLALAAITAAIPFQGQNGATSHKRGVPSIPNLQTPRGKKFIGSPASAKPLQHKPVYEPEAINMHQDGGNTGTIDYPGPLGNNLEVTSALEGLHILLWTKSRQTVAGYTTLGTSGLKWGLAAVDDEMKVQDTWYPEVDGQTLNVAYMELLLDTDQVVVTSKEGQIYIVQVSVAGLRMLNTKGWL